MISHILWFLKLLFDAADQKLFLNTSGTRWTCAGPARRWQHVRYGRRKEGEMCFNGHSASQMNHCKSATLGWLARRAHSVATHSRTSEGMTVGGVCGLGQHLSALRRPLQMAAISREASAPEPAGGRGTGREARRQMDGGMETRWQRDRRGRATWRCKEIGWGS